MLRILSGEVQHHSLQGAPLPPNTTAVCCDDRNPEPARLGRCKAHAANGRCSGSASFTESCPVACHLCLICTWHPLYGVYRRAYGKSFSEVSVSPSPPMPLFFPSPPPPPRLSMSSGGPQYPPCCTDANPEPNKVGRCMVWAFTGRCGLAAVAGACPVACNSCQVCEWHPMHNIYHQAYAGRLRLRRSIPSRRIVSSSTFKSWSSAMITHHALGAQLATGIEPQRGHCGLTTDAGDCVNGASGSWPLASINVQRIDGCAAHCLRHCPRCNFVSFSAHKRHEECSWYTSCPQRQGGYGRGSTRSYQTIQVRRNTSDEPRPQIDHVRGASDVARREREGGGVARESLRKQKLRGLYVELQAQRRELQGLEDAFEKFLLQNLQSHVA